MKLKEHEINELQTASTEELRSVERLMNFQVNALVFIGDRERSAAIRDTARKIILERVKQERK